MSVELKDLGPIMKAELIMAIRGYEEEDRQRWEEGIDFLASHEELDDKILLRVITEPRSKSGIVGIDTINDIGDALQLEDYDEVVFISKSFTKAAREEMTREGIQIISEKFMPSFKPQKLYFALRDYINSLCQIKCGYAPKKRSDCSGRDSEGQYTCNIRLISDNASFHFKQGWKNLLKQDLERLITIKNSLSNSKIDS